MTAQEFIQKKLNELKPTEKIGVNFKSTKDLADFIFKTVMSKKFRKYSVSPEAHNAIRQAIELNIQKNEPIKIAIPFGSYKLWRFEESPEPDWAELFAMIYYACWLKPITEVYEQGVWFDFCGDDAILELMNNTPEEDTEKYKTTFRNLIKFIQLYLPQNFKYTFSPVGERYDSKEDFLLDLNKKIEELKQKGDIVLTEQNIEMMKLNIKPQEGKEIDFQKNRLYMMPIWVLARGEFIIEDLTKFLYQQRLSVTEQAYR